MALPQNVVRLVYVACVVFGVQQVFVLNLGKPIEVPVYGPSGVVAGDLNGDLRFELVVPSFRCDGYYVCQVEIYAATADGRFDLDQSVSAGDHPQAVAIGDMNGDGAPDLVVGNHGHWQIHDPFPFFVAGRISVHFNLHSALRWDVFVEYRGVTSS